MTTRFAVVGSPISHSLSPKLHSAAFSALGLDFGYEAIEVRKGTLAENLASSELSGVSVTMPLKEEAFNLARQHDLESRLTGASNTLIRDGENWKAFNTDVYGIRQTLGDLPIESLSVIGSGATAKSVVLAISEIASGCEVNILSRNEETARALSQFANSQGLKPNIADNTSSLLVDSLVISTVPAGAMSDLWAEIGFAQTLPAGVLFDVAYNPWPSEAARNWKNGRVISGVEMLKWQAVMQASLFAMHFAPGICVDLAKTYQICSDAIK